MAQVQVPDFKLDDLGSTLISAAIPLGGYGLVDQLLYPQLNLFIFEPIQAVAAFIVAAGAAAAAHRFVPRRK
ncbi:MAG: hypothetical protein AAGA08_16930 [Pseudomonadota bacterium]